MRIVVCIKQVPDTTEVRLDPETGTLIRDGVPSIINPDDKSAIEAAIRIKEQTGGHVTVLTMGPQQADSALRESLAMGVDEAVLLTDRLFGGSDTWATSSTLAAAIKKIGYDLIITGRQAIDGDTAQVGPQIAEHLGIPQVSYCEEIKIEGDKFVIKRQFEDRHHIIEVKTPCLFTALTELNEPRYMSFGLILAAYNKEVRIMTYEDIKDVLDISNVGLKGSPTKVKRSFTKTPKALGKLYEVDPNQAVKILVEKLQEKFII